jgi:two-component system, response regulator / RNA-binding antiterminator
MLKILLVNDTNKQVGRLRAALVQAGFDVVEEVSSAFMIPRKVADIQPDVVMIDTESPSRDVLEQIVMVSQDEPRPIVMVSDDGQPAAIRAAIKASRLMWWKASMWPSWNPCWPWPRRVSRRIRLCASR